MLEVILAAGCQNFVPESPNYTGSRLGGLAAKTSALPSLPFKLLQGGFEKHRLGCRRGSEENTDDGLLISFLEKDKKKKCLIVIASLTKKDKKSNSI